MEFTDHHLQFWPQSLPEEKETEGVRAIDLLDVHHRLTN
jgi:hypothetical protein